MSECKHEKAHGRSGGKNKEDRSPDSSPERPKHGLLPIPTVIKEGLLPIPILSKEVTSPEIPKIEKLLDVSKLTPDLTKVATAEVTKVIKEKTSPKITKILTTEVVSEHTGLCKRCEGKEEKEKVTLKTTGIGILPFNDGVPNLLPNPLGILKSDDAQNGHANTNGKAHDKPNQGFGLLPPPPTIGIPGATDIFNPPIVKPGNLIPDPSNIVKTFIVQPFINIVEHFMKRAFEKFREVFNYFAKRPYLALPLMVFLMALLTPVFLFILFAFMTTAVTFIGFIVAESTVLALGGVILVGFLVSIFSVVLMFVSTYGVTYIGLKTIKLVD